MAKRLILICCACALLLQSCAEKKTFTLEDGTVITAEPYGWANKEVKRNPNVAYQVCVPNLVISVVALGSVIVPIYLSGWEWNEPVKLKTCAPNCPEN